MHLGGISCVWGEYRAIGRNIVQIERNIVLFGGISAVWDESSSIWRNLLFVGGISNFNRCFSTISTFSELPAIESKMNVVIYLIEQIFDLKNSKYKL